MKTIGIIGAGNIGGTLAELLVKAGYEVVLANSRGPDTLAERVASLGPRARAATVEEAAREGDMVIEAIPYGRLDALPREALAGKILVTAANHYPERDGDIDHEGHAESMRLQAMIPAARVVKAFNTIYFKHLAAQGDPLRPLAQRRVLPLAGDDADAVNAVAELVKALGFGPLRLGRLAASRGIAEPGGLLYNQDLTLEAAEARLAEDTGQVVVVGAGPGLGAAYARKALRRGGRVTLLSRSGAAEVAAGLEGEVRTVAVDAGDHDALATALAALDDDAPIDTVVFNAVAVHTSALTELDTAALETELRVGLSAWWTVVETLRPRFARRGRGSFLVTGGGAGLHPMPEMGFLSVVKAALRMAVLTLNRSLVDTPLFAGTATVATIVDPRSEVPDRVADAIFGLRDAGADAEVVVAGS
ncbi:MAG: SDR family NAD(P)-dependent oxidoreductase [Myxococcota bacterium]